MERLLLLAGALFVTGMILFAVYTAPGEMELGRDVELLQSIPAELPDNEWFQEQVRGSELPVLVDFEADWCGPCRTLDKIITAAQERRPGEFLVVEVDVDDHKDLAMYYHVESIPMVLLFKNGEVVDGFRGLIPGKLLEEFFERNL